MATAARGLREAFAKFAEDPSRDRFRDLMVQHTGETKQLDFKEEWPTGTTLAKFVLALANSGGGCLVIGVKQCEDGTVESVGLATLRDKAHVVDDLAGYLPSELSSQVTVDDFTYEASEFGDLVGKKFQVITVPFDPDHLPFVAQKDGVKFRSGAIYIRREGMTQEANHEEVQKIVNARIATGHSTAAELELKEHLDQLEALYERVPRTITKLAENSLGRTLARLGTVFGSGFYGDAVSEQNPRYPTEDMQDFVLRMIESKKKRIEGALGLPG